MVGGLDAESMNSVDLMSRRPILLGETKGRHSRASQETRGLIQTSFWVAGVPAWRARLPFATYSAYCNTYYETGTVVRTWEYGQT